MLITAEARPTAVQLEWDRVRALREQRRIERERPRLTVPDFWTSQAHSSIATQHGTIPFEPFPWQRTLIDGITRREIVLKSRDVGSSEICVRYFAWMMLKEGGNLLIKADKWDNARNLVKIARQYLTSLPDGERPKISRDNDTELEIEGVGTIKAMAQGGGRSERCKYLLMTERAFWERPADELAAISGALVADGWQIVESTANGFNDFHALWSDEGNGYRKTFCSWRENPTHTATWRAEKEQELAASPHKLAQEYPDTPNEAFVASGQCLFNTEAIVELRGHVRPPLETRLNGAVKLWRRPEPGHRYLAGADVAEGRDAGNDRLDYSGVAIYDAASLEHVADLHGQWSPEVFAGHAAALCREYNNCLLGVERNNHGHAALLALRLGGYPNLYWHTDEFQAAENLKAGKPPPTKELGWPTTPKTKPLLEQGLAALIASRELVSHDAAFWDESLSYVNLGNSKTGGQPGTHDDRVIKHAIALQMRQARVARPIESAKVEYKGTGVQPARESLWDREQKRQAAERAARYRADGIIK